MTTLRRLPIPSLRDTLDKYLSRVEPLQDERQNQKTRKCVLSTENLQRMQKLHEHLVEADKELAKENPQSSYIEQFWYDAYLLYDASVVLNVNPYFLLQDDRTITQSAGCYGKYTCQVRRTAKLVFSILKFVREIRHGTLKPDIVRGKMALSMDQYSRLFGCSRIPPAPGKDSCHLQVDPTSHHVIVMYKSQFYWFDVLDVDNMPIFSTPEQIEWNLYSIIMDAEQSGEPTGPPFGVFTTESRRVWSNVRDYIFHDADSTNWKNLKIIDSALFVVCLDDVSLTQDNELVKSMLCGTSQIVLDPKNLARPLDAQHGTCLNRWYDKLQLIVTQNGKAGINFEHTGVDGHTVLRLAADIYTDSILGFARGVTKNVPDVFSESNTTSSHTGNLNLITIPRKLEWKVDPFILSSLHFAETRISDSVSQHDFVTLDFTKYGATHIKAAFQCSPDAFVQQMYQLAYYALYGKFETTYEPAMTKAFQNGRTEAIRSVTHESKKFVKSMFDRYAFDDHRIRFLREACDKHVSIIKECSMGLGQDRHLYALYCIWNESFKDSMPLPPLFNDKSWSLLNTNVLSTSNCGNPCLKSFGFGPVTANGFGIGYIIRDDSITFAVSSRHRQTQRFVSLIEHSLLEIDHVFSRKSKAEPIVRALQQDKTAEQQRRSDNLSYLLSGYDYFDVSVSG
ncbi:YAT1 (YAR035W) [Zygosaccharomyces parabailii]|nr:YAT1 (YAR035W) [Zygosaccharomyces parabailii]CDH10361.1 related to mitochondrial carnitine O-acetyltransferase [Zygosaccharomyces bailii ISA1307]